MILTKHNNFIGLLVGQLILIFTMPLLHYIDEEIGKLILHTAIIGMILLTLIGNQRKGNWYKLIITLTIVVAFKSVFFSPVITINQLVGASCIYLLLGIIWAILYSNLFFISPESFAGLSNENNKVHFPEFMYYSYVTLTTLGFGDIIPVSPVAKTLSFMQAIVGQLYLTIMVAGLVGKAINRKATNN